MVVTMILIDNEALVCTKCDVLCNEPNTEVTLNVKDGEVTDAYCPECTAQMAADASEPAADTKDDLPNGT